MGDILTCRVLNKHDDQFMTLCTEWLSSSLKVTVITSEMCPFVGEMKASEIDTFALNLDKTREEYLEETRTILSGRDATIQFFLKDSKLSWKKVPWIHGLVIMKRAPLTEVVPGLLQNFLLRQEGLENAVDDLQTKNGELKATQTRLNEKLEELIVLKNQIEADLYARFIVILNSKKEKIRELELKLQNTLPSPDVKTAVFEAKTDDSEVSGEECVDNDEIKSSSFTTQVVSRNCGFGRKIKREKLLKTQIDAYDGNTSDSDYEDLKRKKSNCKYVDKELSNKMSTATNAQLAAGEPSTSKNLNNPFDFVIKQDKPAINSKLTHSVGQMNVTSEESEEDLFA